MPGEIFPFRYVDPMTGRWVKARYKSDPATIAARYARWEITGPGWTPPDVRGADYSPLAGEKRP